MKITSSEFIASAVKPDGFPGLGFPEIAFVGKSNVGKSSLINKLLNRRALAKTSSTPGKTRLINFFLINRNLVFVDLPGYGYAKVSKTERSRWDRMMADYFSHSAKLKGVVCLQDIRRDQTETDRQMISLLSKHGIPLIMVLTKSDKFSRNQRIKRIKEIERDLPQPGVALIPLSTLSGDGLEALWQAIIDAVGEEGGGINVPTK